MMAESLESLLGIREVAELFNVDISTVRRWERAGHVISLRVGPRGHRRFRRADILHLIDRRQAGSDESRTPAEAQSWS